MKKSLAFSIFVTLTFLQSCTKDTNLRPIKSASPSLPTESYTYFEFEPQRNEVATLGRVLFYERQLSKNNSVSCGSCHKQAFAFADNVAFSAGLNNVKTGRNSMAIQNLPSFSMFLDGDVLPPNGGSDVFFAPSTGFFWDGRENDLRSLVLRPVTNHVEMGITNVDEILEKLRRSPHYADLFNKAFDSSEITAEKISEAVATFMESIQSNNSKFDRFINENHATAMNAEELRGYDLFFTTYNCASCHNPFPGPYFSDAPKNIGLDAQNTDRGFAAITGILADVGVFKVPNLKNVALTAPYMHDGRFNTLDDVLEHYSSGVQNSPTLSSQLRGADGNALRMNITPQDKRSLIAFLNALTDVNIITDPKFSDPFVN